MEFAKEITKTLTTGESYSSNPYRVKRLKNQFISAFAPLFNSKNEVVGIVEYDYESSTVTEAIRAINVHSTEEMVILIVLMLAINYFILKRLIRPLEQLVKSIGIIATGDLTIELAYNDNNEIGRISSIYIKNARYYKIPVIRKQNDRDAARRTRRRDENGI